MVSTHHYAKRIFFPSFVDWCRDFLLLIKPLSKSIKNRLGRYDAAKSLLVNIGQTNNTVTSYMTIWASGYRVKSIKPIEEEKAVRIYVTFCVVHFGTNSNV